ncbi:MAG: hypothetical protein AABZ27_02815 [Candidatus Omnitrophota bacterium]
MEKMKLPVICNIPTKDKWLSMDDYLKFVIFNLRYTSDRKNGRKWKRLLGINVPFVFK